MRIEVDVQPGMEREILAVLFRYRITPRSVEGTPLDRERKQEERLAAEAWKGILRILERGVVTTIDSAVVEKLDGLKQLIVTQEGGK